MSLRRVPAKTSPPADCSITARAASREVARMSKQERDRRYDKKRRNDNPWRKLYNTARWKALREEQLSKQPLCERCLAKGKITPANVAHHIERHEGDENKFWCGIDGLASSCESCHNSDEQQIENRGHSTEVGLDGLPVDQNHPFNKR